FGLCSWDDPFVSSYVKPCGKFKFISRLRSRGNAGSTRPAPALVRTTSTSSLLREHGAMDGGRIRHVRPFGHIPENPVQFVLGNAIVFAPIHLLRFLGEGRFFGVARVQA